MMIRVYSVIFLETDKIGKNQRTNETKMIELYKESENEIYGSK